MVGLLVEQSVIVVHQCRHERRGRGPVIVLLMDEVPQRVEYLSGRLLVFFRNRQLEIAHLSVEGWWELPRRKGHGKVGKESDALNFQVVRYADGVDNRAWPEINQCARFEVTIYEVEVDLALTTGDDAHAVVVDNKGRHLLHNQLKDLMIAMNHRQFIVEEHILAYLRIILKENMAYSRNVK